MKRQMNIKIVTEKIPISELREIAKEFYTDMIKGAVDIERGIVALGGEYHIDASTKLTDNGSKQKDVWGFNIIFSKPKEDWFEYTALINIRPASNNRSMFIEDEKIRDKIKKIVNSKII